jgi:hypothetical protein
MRTTALSAFLFLTLAPAIAIADEATSVSAEAQPRRHEGLYIRLGTGFGSHVESINMEGEDPGATFVGMSSAGEAAIGWAVYPGLVLGLGSYGATVIASGDTNDSTGPMPPPEIAGEVKDFNIAGPFVDWYFDARKGLHAELAIGVATVRGIAPTSGRFDSDNVGVGAGFMIGFGHDWWVSDEWSLGILGRLAFATARSEDDEGVTWEHGVGTTPSLLFTGTYY